MSTCWSPGYCLYHLIIIDIRKQVSDNQTRLAGVTNRVSGFLTQLKTGIYKLIKCTCICY